MDAIERLDGAPDTRRAGAREVQIGRVEAGERGLHRADIGARREVPDERLRREREPRPGPLPLREQPAERGVERGVVPLHTARMVVAEDPHERKARDGHATPS